MTPLANFFIKDMALPLRERAAIRNPDILDIRNTMYGCKCFEITGVLPLIFDLQELSKSKKSGDITKEAVETYSFLPAEKTWIELKNQEGRREAYLLNQAGDRSAELFIFTQSAIARVAHMKLDDFLSYNSAKPVSETEIRLVAFVYFALAIINTPRVVGREEHAPNKGLEKRLRTAKVGERFKLLPWTEIRLEVSKPEEIEDGEPHEAILTGKRALHFCRSHIRVKQGKIEYVTSHWRGDPTLGIRQSKYTVT